MGGTPVLGGAGVRKKRNLLPARLSAGTRRTAEYPSGSHSVDELAVAPPVPFQDCLPASLFIEYGSRFD